MITKYTLLEATRWNKLKTRVTPDPATEFYGDWIKTEDLAVIIDELFAKGHTYQSMEKRTGIHSRRIRAVKDRETKYTNYYFANKFLTRMEMLHRMRPIKTYFGRDKL